MPTRATLNINDGEAAPVSHSFTVDGALPGGVSQWRELNAANPAATKYLTIGLKPSPAKPADFQIPGREVSMRQVNIKLLWPITYVDSATGLTLLDYVLMGRTWLQSHPRATAQACKNLRTVLGNVLLASSLANAYDVGEQFTG